MDKELKALLDMAAMRGNRYMQGDVSLEELPRKMAELGVMLLEHARSLEASQGKELRERLRELQPYVDDFRRVIFQKKNLRAG